MDETFEDKLSKAEAGLQVAAAAVNVAQARYEQLRIKRDQLRAAVEKRTPDFTKDI